MVEFVVDRGLLKLRDQIDALAPGRNKASDGTLGDSRHAAGMSDHNPQDTADSSDRNDPNHEVDALDITHDPAHGCDVGKIWESIRVSEDRRVLYGIFNRRIFSSYAHNGRAAWEWGPYDGDDPHDKHGHMSANDVHNDETQDWKITMTALADKHLVAIMWTDERVEAMLLMLTKTRSGNTNELAAFLKAMNTTINSDYALSKQINEKLDAFNATLESILAKDSSYVDYETLANLIAAKVDNIGAQEVADIVLDDLETWFKRP
jgi:hypothetical protein